MKKLFIVLIIGFSCVFANAQDNLKGSWSNLQKAMGTTVKDMLIFDSELSGNVENNVSICLSTSMMGINVEGETELSLKGVFEYKNGRLIIKWDTESMQQKTVKAINCTYKGESVPEMKAELEKAMAEVIEEIKKDSKEEDNYESVTFKKGKLTLTERDEKGKKQSDTYTFVK